MSRSGGPCASASRTSEAATADRTRIPCVWTLPSSLTYNPPMPRRSLASSLHRLGVVLALALSLPAGCGKTKSKLTEVAVPEAGVSMRYDLAPGQEYAGHVKVRNTLPTPVGDVLTTLEFDVALVVTGSEDASGKLVQATVKGIGLDLRLPEGVTPEMIGLDPQVAKGLDGTELKFNLGDHGEVNNEPEPPESAPLPTKAILGMITTGLMSAFVRVPEQPVKDGESWDAKSKESDVTVKSATVTGTLAGLGRNAAGEDIAQLVYAANIEAEKQGQAIKIKQDVKASFSTTGGYPVTVERKINNELVGQATVLIEIEAEWKKGGKQAVEVSSPPTGEVQAITDPCDPDYVGAEECTASEAAPEG